MKVGLVECGHLDVFQRKRVGPCCNDNIVAVQRCMGQNVCEAGELALAELNRVVSRSGGNKVLDDVAAEVCGKHESVAVVAANEDVIAWCALQCIAACRAEDRTA